MVEIKVASVLAVCVVLHSFNPEEIEEALLNITSGDDDFFENEFALLELGSMQEKNDAPNWREIIASLKKFNLRPVAIRNSPKELIEGIIDAGMIIENVQVDRDRDYTNKELQNHVIPAADITDHVMLTSPMIIDTPVRAGQRVYARGCDLIITAVVNNGAEVIADGSIHVYAPLRGRALAGANGNVDARIFAQVMEPELVSVAGIYRTFENGFPPNLSKKAGQVRLDGERLIIAPLESLVKA